MTHLYIKLCDLCGRPCEVDGGLHGGSIHTDIMIDKGKFSHNVFREEFDVCITCLKTWGLWDTFAKMKVMKYDNAQKKIDFKKLLEHKKILRK